MAELAQLVGQRAQALRRPPQRQLGIAAGVGVDQPLEIAISVGSASASRLRPAPGRRTRPGSSLSPRSSSARPRAIVERAIPVARETADVPPRP